MKGKKKGLLDGRKKQRSIRRRGTRKELKGKLKKHELGRVIGKPAHAVTRAPEEPHRLPACPCLKCANP